MGEQPSSRAQRVAAEDAFGPELHRAIGRSDLTVGQVAEALGIDRSDLYHYLRGERHLKAGALDRLPRQLAEWYVRTRALRLGLSVQVAPTDHDEQTGVETVVECADVIRAVTLMDADRVRAPAELSATILEVEELEAKCAAFKAQLLGEKAAFGVRAVK